MLPLAVMLGACQADEPTPAVSDDSRSVTFDVSADGAKGPTTTWTIDNFKLSAFTAGQWGGYETLMDRVTVTRTGLNKWTYSPAVEWPGDRTVDFLAVSPSWVDVGGYSIWQSFLFNGAGADTDLLVAVRMNVSQTGGRLKLNFRHALARVTVSLKTSLVPPMSVRVAAVTIRDVADYGNFTFPHVSTSAGTNTGELFDAWQVYNSMATRYKIFEATDPGGYTALTQEPVQISGAGLYMIPLKLTPLQFSGYFNGSHIEVTYQIVNQDTGDVVWPDDSTDGRLLSADHEGYANANIDIAAPTPDSKWLPGKTYRYTLDISSGATIPKSASRSVSQVDCDVNNY